MNYCNQCGAENPSESKFCMNCGSKLPEVQTENNPMQPVYEKVEAEILAENENAEVPVYSAQDELNIRYESEETTSSSSYETPNQQYYSSGTVTANEVSNGNIGFSIAAMVFGIISILCCCFTLFSVILAIVAIVLGIVSLNGKYDGKGMAIAGIATGGFGLVLDVIMIICYSTEFITGLLG